jgi:hypothetical protein
MTDDEPVTHHDFRQAIKRLIIAGVTVTLLGFVGGGYVAYRLNEERTLSEAADCELRQTARAELRGAVIAARDSRLAEGADGAAEFFQPLIEALPPIECPD